MDLLAWIGRVRDKRVFGKKGCAIGGGSRLEGWDAVVQVNFLQ